MEPEGKTGVAVEELGAGVWHFQAPLWQTNSLLAIDGDEALVCDPALAPEEVEFVRAEASRRASGRISLLVTHADFDHVCGIPYFAEAEVVAGEETASRIESGAAEELKEAGHEWGMAWLTDGLRVDRTVSADGEFTCGRFRVEAIEAASHGRDGLAYVLLNQGILLPGDHLSDATYPLLAGSLARAAEAAERLLDALDRYELSWVVPGHGPVLRPDAAREVGEADLAYLRALAAAASEAAAERLSPGFALLHVYSVEPPRTNTADFEIYGIRAGNARQALADVDARLATEA